MIAGIILAAGKGTRLKSKTINKVVLPFLGKPMIHYAVEKFKPVTSKIVIVIGAFAESVKSAVNGEKNIIYAYQKKRMGTAHALKVGAEALKSLNPELVVVGFGDHMMFYNKKTIADLVKMHKAKNATVSLISTIVKDPFGYGRIIRDGKDHISNIIEEKDATPKIRKIKEINAGLYCFDYSYLMKNIKHVKKSPITKEYYINELIKIADNQGKKVVGLVVPYHEVGIGVNRHEELASSQVLYQKLHQ